MVLYQQEEQELSPLNELSEKQLKQFREIDRANTRRRGIQQDDKQYAQDIGHMGAF